MWISDLLPSLTFFHLHSFIHLSEERPFVHIKIIYNDHCAFLVTGCGWWQNALWWLHYQHWSSGKLVIHLSHTWHSYCGLLCQHTHTSILFQVIICCNMAIVEVNFRLSTVLQSVWWCLRIKVKENSIIVCTAKYTCNAGKINC